MERRTHFLAILVQHRKLRLVLLTICKMVGQSPEKASLHESSPKKQKRPSPEISAEYSKSLAISLIQGIAEKPNDTGKRGKLAAEFGKANKIQLKEINHYLGALLRDDSISPDRKEVFTGLRTQVLEQLLQIMTTDEFMEMTGAK